MRPIPIAVRKRLAMDGWMKNCKYRGCNKADVEWDHVWTGIGQKQVNEWWGLVPFCYDHHRGLKRTKDVQEYGQWLSLMRGLAEAEKKYPKTDWRQLKKYLDGKFLHKNQTDVGK